MTKTLLATAVALSLAATAAFAQAPARTPVDADRDGRITRAEAAAQPRLAERFDTLDANRDGVIDSGERPRRGPRGGQGGMQKIDTDQDGRIARAEAAGHPRLAERFDTLDANRDGYLDAGERPRRGEGGKRGGMARLDTNQDGRLSAAEVSGHPKLAERFAAIDANRDGTLTREEMKAAHAARRQQAAPAR